MQWFQFAAAAAACAAVLVVLGLPPAWAVGLRGFWLWAVTPAFAVTVAGGAALVAPLVGLRWSLLPALLLTAAISVAIAWLRHALGGRGAGPAGQGRFDFWLLISFVVASVLLTAQIVRVIATPDAISQTFDNVFHLNAVRFVLDTGNASSLSIGRMTNPDGALGFYPAAWHGLVALVVQLAGASIPTAVNSVTLVVSAIVWPLAIILLTRTLIGRRPAVAATAAIMAASLPVFPVLLMDYGVLYPYQLGVALVPIALAVTLRLLKLAGPTNSQHTLWWSIVLLGTLPGIALAHPGGFVAWLALSTPMVTVFLVGRWRGSHTVGGRILVSVCAVAYLIVGLLLVKYLRPPLEARLWPTQMTVPDAILDVVTASAWYPAPAVLSALAVLAGILWACVRRTMPSLVALGMYIVAGVLFVAVAALPFATLRDALTGSWYNNLPRLAALLPIAMVPLGAFGVAATWSRLASWDTVRAWKPSVRASVAAVVALAAVLLTQLGPLSPVRAAEAQASFSFALTSRSALLSSEERALIARIDQHVPEGVAIAGSPWTGASLAYALADRPVLMPHTLMEIPPELNLINTGLAEAERGDQTCDALEDLDVGFVLDFGPLEVHGGVHDFPGLSGLATSDAVRLVDSEGEARLYEIVACGA